MGIFDGWRARRAEKLRIQLDRAQDMARDAKDIMKTIESPYVDAKKNLNEYETQLKFKPAKAYKYASRGYTSAVSESEAAKIHTEAMELLESQKRLDDKIITNLDSRYRSAISVGKTKTAKKYAYRLYAQASKNPDATPLKISLDDSSVGNGRIDIVISNRGTRPIVVNTIVCRSASMQLYMEERMAEVVPAGGQFSRVVDFDPDSSLDIVVTVDYEMGFEQHKLRRTFSVRKKV